jgi:predicted O-methyltransferase YrrM
MLKQIDTSFLVRPEPEKKGEKFNGQGWGYLDPSLLDVRTMLEEVSSLTKNVTNIIEVGMFAGHSTVCLLEHFPEAKVTSLDPGKFSEISHIPIKERYGDRFTFIPSTLPKTEVETPDLVFIDGNHSYESVVKDIKKTFEIKPRYILFDNVELPGVRQAIKEYGLFNKSLFPKYWFYVITHKENTTPGIIMFLDMETYAY